MARGKKITDESERRQSITIRLEKRTLDLLDETLVYTEKLRELIEDQSFENIWKLPKNRTELISWILDTHLNDVRWIFAYLDHVETWVSVESGMNKDKELIERIISNNPIYSGMVNIVMVMRQKKQLQEKHEKEKSQLDDYIGRKLKMKGK